MTNKEFGLSGSEQITSDVAANAVKNDGTRRQMRLRDAEWAKNSEAGLVGPALHRFLISLHY
jgi:hypothetical protein